MLGDHGENPNASYALGEREEFNSVGATNVDEEEELPGLQAGTFAKGGNGNGNGNNGNNGNNNNGVDNVKINKGPVKGSKVECGNHTRSDNKSKKESCKQALFGDNVEVCCVDHEKACDDICKHHNLCSCNGNADLSWCPEQNNPDMNNVCHVL
jgi:hypothetical protein